MGEVTSTSVPTVADLLGRARLRDAISSGRAAVLAAPSGYGKSVLAEQFVEHRGGTAVRVRLAGPTGPAELVDALRRAARRGGVSDLSAVLADADPLGAVDGLVSLTATRADGLLVVVDEAQLLDADACRLLRDAAIDLTPPSFVLAAGRDGDWASGWPGIRLGPDDLRMDTSEIAAVVALITERPPAAGVVDDLATVTAGWPAAVAVAAQHLRSDPTWSLSARSAGRGMLANLVGELVGDDGDLLARVAHLPLIDEATASLVAGPAALSRLARSGLPTRAERGSWLVVPDSIRDVLEAPPLEPAVAREVAARYARLGELATATRYLADRGDGEGLAALLADQHWTDLETLGHARLAHLVSLLDDAHVARHPHALIGALQAVDAGRTDLRRTWLDRLGRAGLDAPTARAVEAERLRLAYGGANLAELVEQCQAVLAQTEPDERVTRGRTLLLAARAHAFFATAESYALAEDQLREAATLFELAGEQRWRTQALGMLGYNVLFHQGRFADAAAVIETCLALLPRGDRTRAAWLAEIADILDALGRDAEAESAIAEAVEIGERLNDPSVVATALWTKAWTVGRRGDVAEVRRLLGRIEELRPPWIDGLRGIELYGSLSDHFVTWGATADAQRCQERALALHERLDYPVAIEMMLGRSEALLGDPARGLELLARYDGESGNAPNTRWVRHLEAAVAHHRLGDLEAARERVDAARSMTAAMGVPDLPLRFESAIVRSLADVWPSEEVEHAGTGATGPTVVLLGRFAVHDRTADVTPPAGHPSTLVKLIALRGTMTVDAVIDALWPDADLETGRSRLRNTMNRLRNRSGAVLVRQGETLVLGDGVTVDVDLFERAAAAALAGDDSTRAGLARHAVSLYGGELLPGDVYEDWAAAPREWLARRYLSLVDVVAAAAEVAGDLDEAARLLDAGIAADPLDEARYLALHDVLARQGRAGAARQVAEGAARVFRDVGIELHPTLRAALG